MPPKKQKKEQEKAPGDESFQAVDISTREPRTVILMLSSPEPTVVVKALQALHQHMKKCMVHHNMKHLIKDTSL
jgi:hypothetical protein